MIRRLSTLISRSTVRSLTISANSQVQLLTRSLSLPAMSSKYFADASPPVCSLSIAAPFAGLTAREKMYAHHMSLACWSGSRIIMNQTSRDAETIFDFIITTFSSSSSSAGKMTDLKAMKAKAGLANDDWEAVLSYSAQVLSNLAAFKSFGSVKFIPRCDPAVFERVIEVSERRAESLALWNKISVAVFSTEPEGLNKIGKPSQGHMSAYYSYPAPSDAEIEEAETICNNAGIATFNTRLLKKSDGTLTLLVASASSILPTSYPSSLRSDKLGFTLNFQAGDFSSPLQRVNASLSRAAEYAATDNQKNMLLDYVESFEHGSVDKHKDGSRKWVKDISPVIESYIGFIETYQDPYGGRAEFEGFVALVNKEQSKKFNTLVDIAPRLITDLPWGPDFEVATFQRPDFTSLEVLSFATGGIPAGINIPNYHDVREHDGFKNVSLSNILSAKAAGEEYTFIGPDQVDEYARWEGKAFEVQVANHELLGHGSGKLLQETSPGIFNFDRDLLNPLTGKKVDSWYKTGESYGSKIGSVSASMEECRAEAVALYLASNREILSIFGFSTDQDADDLTYWTFVVMARAGIRALEWYDPATARHGQAHMEARLGITNWLMQHGLVSIEEVRDSDGQLTNAYVRVDREKVLKEGKSVMGKLLVEIQVRKSLGDREGATESYGNLTKPNNFWITSLRPIVIAKKLPRKIFVQPNTIIDATGEVRLVEYDVSVEGVLQSFVERGL